MRFGTCPLWWFLGQAAIVIPLFIVANVQISDQYQLIETWSPPRNVLAKPGEESWIVDSPGCGVDTGGCGSNLPHKVKFKPLFHQKMLCNHLSPAWHTDFTGRLIDSTGDMQWSSFRNALPELSLFFIVFLLGKRLLCYVCAVFNVVSVESAKCWYYGGVGMAWLGYLHAWNVLVPGFILCAHFLLTQRFVGTLHFTKFMWLFHLVLMLGVQFGHPWKLGQVLGEGVVDWTSYYPLLTLRMLSHCLDLHFHALPSRKDRSSGLTLAERVLETPSKEASKSFLLFFAYLSYPPLYLSGPTLTFNAFVSYLRHPDQLHSSKMIALYALRFLFCLLLMEIATMYMYHFAIARTRATRGKNGLTVWEQLFEGQLFLLLWFTYILLKLIWLKFLLIWRFARLVTLLDGLDCPENMAKCMSNHHSIKAFWQSWHASFNQWLVRYLYIPLGGSRVPMLRQIMNVFLVFTFVAIWHQVSLQLLCWAWVLVVVMVPELVFAKMIRSSAVVGFAQRYPITWDRMQVLAGAIMIVALKIACAVGFGYSLDGLGSAVKLWTGWRQIGELSLYVALMYSAVRLMQGSRKWDFVPKIE